MKNSTKDLIEEIIELDDCPFTEFEVHGFFIGLVLSSEEQKTKKDKMMKFLDLTEESLPLTDKLINLINSELSKDYFEISPESDDVMKENIHIKIVHHLTMI